MPPGEKKKSNRSIADARIERYYNKIVFGFIAITAILIVIILYFSFSKTTITITPNNTETTIEVTVNSGDVEGMVLLTDVEGEKNGTASGETTASVGKSSGTATIINNSSRAQTLVETTRLLSKEGVLFRTQERVVVPANGSIDVAVAADSEGESGDIGPTTFEIVALNASSKELIYAESKESMQGGTTTTGVVSQTDIANTQNDLEDELLDNATTTFAEELDGREGLPEDAMLIEQLFIVDSGEEGASVQAGDTVEEFTVTRKMTVAAVVVSKSALERSIRETSTAEVPQGSKITSDVNPENAEITVESIDDERVTAKISVTLPIQTTIDLSSDVLNPEKLTNKSTDEVKQYLSDFEEIESVELKFSPFWVRSTPSIADNISIEIK